MITTKKNKATTSTRAARRLFKKVQTAEKGRLSRAGRADDNDLFAFFDMLVDATENLVVAERFFQSFNVYHFRAASFQVFREAW